MAEPKYIIAKYVPDTLRMEPLNIGVILWSSGSVACRFLPVESARFVADRATYQRWVEYWINACEKSSLAYRKKGCEVSRKSPDFLDALIETQKGAYRLYEAGFILKQVPAAERDAAVDILYKKLVATEDDETVITPRESLESRCNSIFQEAGLWDREEFASGMQLELEAAGVRQSFKFDHIWKNGHLGALFQRVNLKLQPSTTNAAFLFEHAKKTVDTKEAMRFAMIDSSAAEPDAAFNARREMLQHLCKVVDVADQDQAIEAVSQVLSL